MTYIDNSSELFNLKEQAAIDLGRFDVIKDIQRLEYLVSSKQITKGYMLFVTNCSSYWTNKTYNGSEEAQDNEFKLIENRILNGNLKWKPGAKESTYGKKRINGLKLEGFYKIKWNDLIDLNNGNGKFRYLMIEIPPKQN